MTIRLAIVPLKEHLPHKQTVARCDPGLAKKRILFLFLTHKIKGSDDSCAGTYMGLSMEASMKKT